MNTNTNQLEIYPHMDGVFAKEQERLSKANISLINKKIILQFQNHLFTSGAQEYRVSKLLSQMRRICLWFQELGVKKHLDCIKSQDITLLISFINRRRVLSEATKSDYRRCVKQFFRWYRHEDKRLYSTDVNIKREADKLYDLVLKNISVSYKEKEIDPSTIITDEDIDNVIEKGAITPRDKAFLEVLHESGCRIGEFLNLRVNNISFEGSYVTLVIPYGKTGSRKILLIKSVPRLKRYLDVHSFRNKPNSYLWLSEAQHNRNSPLLYRGGQKLVSRCFKRAGIQKKHNLHWFRHSRASILAPKVTESVLCKYMGWTKGSQQVKTYVHLCDKQIEQVFLELYGLQQKKEKETLLKCICGTMNRNTERYCHNCYQPLKLETAIQEKEVLESEMNKTVQFLMELSKNSDMMEKFLDFKTKIQEKGL